jgi:F-type H+-transporting ATPase subunit b
MFDATFWVAIAFLLFVLLLVFKKVPQAVLGQIDSKINELKNKINEAEDLKSNSEKLLSEAKNKLQKSDDENSDILAKAQKNQ